MVFQGSALRLGIVELFSPNFTFPLSAESKADYCFGDDQYKHICEQIGVKYLLVSYFSTRLYNFVVILRDLVSGDTLSLRW